MWCKEGRGLFHLFKVFFPHSAEGAYPIVGDVFKRCSGGNAAVGVSGGWVVHPVAHCAAILFHDVCFVLGCCLVIFPSVLMLLGEVVSFVRSRCCIVHRPFVRPRVANQRVATKLADNRPVDCDGRCSKHAPTHPLSAAAHSLW